MKRFIALIGVMLLFMGIRLYNNGLLGCGYAGQVSVGEYDPVPIETPLLIDGPHRMDCIGGEDMAYDMIENLSATVLWTEELEGIKIIYAYSPRLMNPVEVADKEVNLMIAISGINVSAGTPLLYGSY